MNAFNTHNRKMQIETDISDKAFARIVSLARTHAGIVLSDTKKSMVQSRLTRRLRALNIPKYEMYLDQLDEGHDTSEIGHFVSALTTNVSHFFREEHHFRFLEEQAVPAFKEKLANNGPVRIWSAGCSNGQEPYSIAMTLKKCIPEVEDSDIKILATDIDPEVLARAKSGSYPENLRSGLPQEFAKLYFEQSNLDDSLTANDSLRKLVTFRRLNLHEKWPMKGQFDAIFCRNVIIYFDEKTQEDLFRKFSDALVPGGYLLLGHSERLSGSAAQNFTNAGVTTYKKTTTSTEKTKEYTHGAS